MERRDPLEHLVLTVPPSDHWSEHHSQWSLFLYDIYSIPALLGYAEDTPNVVSSENVATTWFHRNQSDPHQLPISSTVRTQA